MLLLGPNLAGAVGLTSEWDLPSVVSVGGVHRAASAESFMVFVPSSGSPSVPSIVWAVRGARPARRANLRAK